MEKRIRATDMIDIGMLTGMMLGYNVARKMVSLQQLQVKQNNFS